MELLLWHVINFPLHLECFQFRDRLILLVANQMLMTEASSGRWLSRQSPILYDHVYHGEIYDARLAVQPPAWSNAIKMQPIVGTLAPLRIPPVRFQESFSAQSVTLIASGCSPRSPVWVFDYGHNMAGVCTLTVDNLPAGTSVFMQHTETIKASGCPNSVYYTEGEDYSMPAW